MTRNRKLSIVMKGLVLTSSIVGILFDTLRSIKEGRSGGSSLYYYTIQTNIFTGVMALLFLFFLLFKKRENEVPHTLYYIKYMSTAAITLTFVVFSVLLAPLVSRSYLFSCSNIFLHNVTPLLAIADFIFFDIHYKSRKTHILLTIVVPLFYTFLTLIFSFSGIRFNDGAVAPYFFLDYEKYGWLTISKEGFGVIIWIILISFLVLGLGSVLLWGNRLYKRKRGAF